jgi:hypothetical protein
MILGVLMRSSCSPIHQELTDNNRPKSRMSIVVESPFSWLLNNDLIYDNVERSNQGVTECRESLPSLHDDFSKVSGGHLALGIHSISNIVMPHEFFTEHT